MASWAAACFVVVVVENIVHFVWGGGGIGGKNEKKKKKKSPVAPFFSHPAAKYQIVIQMKIVISNIAVLYLKRLCHHTIVNLISLICYVMYLGTVISRVAI